jgi:hypothetical protein
MMRTRCRAITIGILHPLGAMGWSHPHRYGVEIALALCHLGALISLCCIVSRHIEAAFVVRVEKKW